MVRNAVLLLGFIALSTLITHPSSAAEKKAQRLVCLEAVQCNKAGSACVGEKTSHRVRLTSQTQHPSIPGEKTYIVECLSTPKGQICTTGNGDTVPDIGWNSSLSDLKATSGYEFKGVFKQGISLVDQSKEPIISDNQGMIEPLEWHSSTTQSTYRTFYALNFYEPTVLQGEGQTSQQQGTFDLTMDNSDCTSLQWDPYGIVFNAQTLEPIPNARVTLFQKTFNGYSIAILPGVTSTIQTLADGAFSFVVPDGVYKLEATHPDYLTTPATVTNVHPNYPKIYSDLYPTNGIEYDITQTGGIPQHREIPLIPKPSTTGIYPVQVIDYYQVLQKFNSVLLIKGRVSHPFTNIKVYTNINKRYLPVQIRATKEGVFRAEIPMNLLTQGEYVAGLEFEKVDLQIVAKKDTKNIISSLWDFIFKQVDAQQQTTDLQLQPIPNSLEGYAYNASGSIMPNATVGIYLSFSQSPYYETTTDAQGFFKINSEFLPTAPYSIRYTTNGSTVNVTTSEFLTKNAEYISTKGINSFVYVKPTAVINEPTPVVTAGATNEPIVTPTPRNQSRAYFLIIIGILVIGIGGTVLGVYIINKKNGNL